TTVEIDASYVGNALAHHEYDRAVGFFQDCGCGFAEEQLLAGPALDAHHDEVVPALLDLLEDGFVRGVFGPHRGFGIDIVAFTERDDVLEHGLCHAARPPPATVGRRHIEHRDRRAGGAGRGEGDLGGAPRRFGAV